jgi:hypothetical protein
VDLGQGWTTKIESVGYYGIGFVALLSSNPVYSAGIMAAFGAGRALPVAVNGLLTARPNHWELIYSYESEARALRAAAATALAVGAGLLIAK